MAFLELDSLWVSELADGVASLVLDVPGSKTNVLSRKVLEDLATALARVQSEGRFRLLILRSGKDHFFASGPGIEELATLKSAESFAELSRRGQEVFAQLAELPIPSVAIIDGACREGGLELALACDYRVAIASPATRLGFAGAELGLMPAWGGTQRLPRRVGLERSFLMLLGDRQLPPQTALDWGLVDAVVQSEDDEPPTFLADARKRPSTKLPLRTWRQKFVERFRWGRAILFGGTRRLLTRQLADDLPAPWEIFEALRLGISQGIDAGLHHERTAFARLGQNAAHRNLLNLQQTLARVRGAGPGSRRLKNIGIVGAGARGLQILSLAVTRGCHVVVQHGDETSLGQSLFQMISVFGAAVQNGTMTREEFQKNVAAIKGSVSWKGFEELDLVLDALDPEEDRQRLGPEEIERHVPPGAVLAITGGEQALEEVRPELEHPERLGSLHFVPPVARGGVVEIVGPPDVPGELARDLSAWSVHLGCIPVLVRDRPGLLVERICLAALQEASALLLEGFVLSRIDQTLRRFGMVNGPFEQADLAGIDRLAELAVLLESAHPDRFPAVEVIPLMIEYGWLGRKTKLGFFSHGARTLRPNRRLLTLIQEMRTRNASPNFYLSLKEQMDRIRQRVVLRTLNEAAWCVEEGLVESAESLDFALAMSGWAPHRGGPISYARQRGPAEIVQTMERLAKECGPRFESCPMLRKL